MLINTSVREKMLVYNISYDADKSLGKPFPSSQNKDFFILMMLKALKTLLFTVLTTYIVIVILNIFRFVVGQIYN